MLTPPSLTAPVPTKRRIKRFAPLQLGKVLGILYGAMGLLFMPIFILASLSSASLPEAQRGGMMIFGMGFAIAMPILYAFGGFIFGAIGALLYNLVAKWVGGIEVEVEVE